MATTPVYGWPYPDRGTASNSWSAALALRLDKLQKAAAPKLTKPTLSVRSMFQDGFIINLSNGLDARRDCSKGIAWESTAIADCLPRVGYAARAYRTSNPSVVLPAPVMGRATGPTYVFTFLSGGAVCGTGYTIEVTAQGDGTNYSNSDTTLLNVTTSAC